MLRRGGRIALSRRRALIVLPIWAMASFWLWQWWLQNIQSANLWLFIPLTFAVFFEYLVMPLALMYSIFIAKAPKNRKVLKDKKVAVITPCVPSQESLTVIRRQLSAMSKISYKHDSWILDEGGDKRIKKLASQYGVKYFSRKGIKKYNQDIYPFKAKSKAGNINAWLDKVKDDKYDFFVQLDIDHLPTADYLDKTLGHFRDKNVAWVQAPSVYGNLDNWTARGSAEQELGFHGPLQMSLYSAAKAPVIVGSHTTFRMKAIREINGFQPTRAEDHLNTLALMSKGYSGVFIPEVIAVGDGPETFNAYLSQQYAWAFSMMQIVKSHSLQHLKKISPIRRLHYLFLQTWYPLWSLSYLILFMVPVLGLLFNTYAFNAEPNSFLYYMVPAFVASLLVWWTSIPLGQPQGLALSWRGMLLHVIRWPVIFMAITSAIAGRTKPYQVTPKGRFLKNIPTIKLYKPFLLLSAVSSSAIILSLTLYEEIASVGLLIFASMSLGTMLSVCILDMNIRIREQLSTKKGFSMSTQWLKPITAVFAVTLLSGLSFIAAFNTNVQAMLSTDYAISETILEKDLHLTQSQRLSDEELAQELSSRRYKISTETPVIGIHENSQLSEETRSYIQHEFYDWREDRRIAEDLLGIIRAGNTPFLTIEPKGNKDGAKLLSDINAGAHDETIRKFIDRIGSTDHTVYVRFAHEMDFAELYPWGNQEPDEYIAAYRRVTQIANEEGASNIKWVWGPGGVFGAEKYYPGDDVVDVIGSTVLYDQYWAGQQTYPFHDLVNERLWLQKFGKPVWITEFGIGRANPDLQESMIKEALDSYLRYGFKALIYVNIADANISGPDYRIAKPESYELLKSAMKDNINKQPKADVQHDLQIPSSYNPVILKAN